MSREQKLALIVGFSLILLVGVLISDHLSRARQSKVGPVMNNEATVLTDVGLHAPPAPLSSEPRELASATDGGTGTFAGLKTALENGYREVVQADHPAAVSTAPVASNPEAAFPTGVHPINDPRLIDSIGRSGGDVTTGPDGLPVVHVPVDTAQPQPEQQGRPFDLIDPALPKAKPQQPRPDDANMRWHTVKKGDTLTSIAKQYYGTTSMVATLTDMNQDRIGAGGVIRTGARLRVPVKDTVASNPAAPAKDQPKAAPKPPAKDSVTTLAQGKKPATDKPKPAAPRTYTVKSGDTLGTIAQKLLGSSRRAPEIIDLNGNVLDDEDAIHVGTVLKLPPERVASR